MMHFKSWLGKEDRPPPLGPQRSSTPPRHPIPTLLMYALMIILTLWIWQDALSDVRVRTIPYSEFKAHLAAREVTEATIGETEIEGKIVSRPKSATQPAEPGAGQEAAGESFLFRTIRVEDPKLVEELQAAKVKFVGVRPGFLTQFLWAWLVPLGLILLIWWFLSRRLGGAAQSMLSVGRSRAKLVGEKETKVTFNDVAGCDEAKAELREVVEFLKEPQRYDALGAKIPKGVLLVGPPGTGKTLLARAVAGEAGVPFFLLAGSDFVEMFVGVGAARVRDLFQQAKAQVPCIVFIDELDAIGRQRGVHVGPVNDEREQTLNQLLVEMDGFEPNAGVILLAATNRPEVLDRALLRPGRFDRQVLVDSPDMDGRKAILEVHARGKRLAPDVDLRRIAQGTPGFSGADLANALNEAALLAARRHASEITQQDLEEAVEKVVAGPERKSRRLNEEEKKRVAYHEAGHALVAMYCPNTDPVHKISIVPRGRAALGYTMQLPTEDQFLMTRAELHDRLASLLGGRAAEEIAFGEISTGAENDIERATAQARQMVCLYGMSEKIGLVHCGQREQLFLTAPETSPVQRDCSERTAEMIDAEVKRLLDEAHARAKAILREHSDELECVATELLRRETLDRQALELLVHSCPRKEPPRRSEPVGAGTNGESGGDRRADVLRASPPSDSEGKQP